MAITESGDGYVSQLILIDMLFLVMMFYLKHTLLVIHFLEQTYLEVNSHSQVQVLRDK